MTLLDTMPRTSDLAQVVAPDVYRVTTGISNAYLVIVSGGGYVIVDTGDKGYGKKVMKAAQDLFEHVRPNAILLTHGHFDHAGGVPELLAAWPDVPVYAHPLELPYLNEDVRYPPGDPTVGGAMAEMSRFMDTSRPTHLPTPAQPYPEEAGALDIMPGWELRPTPGHTPGHVSLWNEEEKILIAGDAVVTLHQNNPLAVLSGAPVIFHPPPYATYNWHHARQSARALAELNPRYLCAGHGQPMSGNHVAKELHRFADRFPHPKRGRYVHTPARFNRQGPVFIPPKPVDYVKGIVLAGGALALGASLYLMSRKNRPDVDLACE
jgi:glyoxylase-like metal-dependent hydrolase (beta-lactamase superfamily II)